ncbi:zinc finger and SCAN domain-containing protein 2-like [Nematolebias whitei]|uniref:zinc finger and SCAN domain-containing protein 2-like n=1 Tax=Nematolebias whitei TaxID=451745 RepID=UPI00189A561E|nr:zinc finger and SCAN domain-containing protein 2-like [Nematolebias whitei]
MFSIHYLREFIGERLSAAASEIFSEFEKTILRYEEELDRQRRLLDVSWKPELKLHRVDLQQEPVHKMELILTDQQLYNQERNSSLDQEEPEPESTIIKEEEEQELCSNQDEDQLQLKQETDPFMVTALFEESEPEPDEEQLIFQSSAGPEDQDSGSHENSEHSQKTDHTDRRHGDKADQPATFERLFSCQICGETFIDNSHLIRHIKVHSIRNQNSDRLQYCCPFCGKSFPAFSKLVIHIRSHTGEKLYVCKTCGKRFSHTSNLNRHKMIHTGERPFFCQTCGKSFNQSSSLKIHMLIHTGEKPFSCQTCGKCFNHISHRNRHMKVHTD